MKDARRVKKNDNIEILFGKSDTLVVPRSRCRRGVSKTLGRARMGRSNNKLIPIVPEKNSTGNIEYVMGACSWEKLEDTGRGKGEPEARL